MVSIAVAALLGVGCLPRRGREAARRRTTAAVAGAGRSRSGRRAAVFRWQEQHDSALTEAALASGVRDGAWHVGLLGVVFEVCFDTEERWEAFRGLRVSGGLDAVPDPVNGLLICRSATVGAGNGGWVEPAACLR